MDLKLQSHLFSQHCPCFRHIRKIQKCQKAGCWRNYFILLGILFLFCLALFGEQEESPMTTYNSSAAYNWASSLGMLHKTRESQILKSPITEDFNDQTLRLSESNSAQNYIMDVSFVWPWTGHKFQFRSRWKSWTVRPNFPNINRKNQQKKSQQGAANDALDWPIEDVK